MKSFVTSLYILYMFYVSWKLKINAQHTKNKIILKNKVSFLMEVRNYKLCSNSVLCRVSAELLSIKQHSHVLCFFFTLPCEI